MVYVHALYPSSLQIFVHLVLQEEVDMIFLRRVELMRGAMRKERVRERSYSYSNSIKRDSFRFPVQGKHSVE